MTDPYRCCKLHPAGKFRCREGHRTSSKNDRRPIKLPSLVGLFISDSISGSKGVFPSPGTRPSYHSCERPWPEPRRLRTLQMLLTEHRFRVGDRPQTITRVGVGERLRYRYRFVDSHLKGQCILIQRGQLIGNVLESIEHGLLVLRQRRAVIRNRGPALSHQGATVENRLSKRNARAPDRARSRERVTWFECFRTQRRGQRNMRKQIGRSNAYLCRGRMHRCFPGARIGQVMEFKQSVLSATIGVESTSTPSSTDSAA